MTNDTDAGLLTDEVVEYLEKLRDTGDINMLAAGKYLEAEFDMGRQEASAIIRAWISIS